MNIKKIMISCLTILTPLFFLSSLTWAGEIKGTVSNPKNTAVYLEGAQGGTPPPSQPAVLDQKSMKFIPHVLVVQKGTKVCFRNSDKVVHNIHSYGPKKFNYVTLMGKDRCVDLTDAGEYPVGCDMHPEMSAFVIVTPNSFYSKPDAQGNFVIKNVPAGTYTVKVWREKGAKPSQSVTVTDQGPAEVSFN